MKVTIYHSTFCLMPWSSDAPMSRVDEFELPTEQFAEPSDEALEHVFRIHNAVDGTERNVRLELRSLSVGDVVQLDERAFAVEPIGWTEIEPGEINIEELTDER
jgi:hypothetical protein